MVENLDSSVTDYTVSTSGRASVFSTYVPQGFSLDPGERRTIFTYMTPRSTTSLFVSTSEDVLTRLPKPI